MLKELIILSLIIFWFLALYSSIIILLILIDRFIKKENKHIDNALTNIITAIGVLSAIIFFACENISKINYKQYIYKIQNILFVLSLSTLIIYLLKLIISAIKKIIKGKKIRKNIKNNFINLKNEHSKLNSSSLILFSKEEWLSVIILSLIIIFLLKSFNFFLIK